MVLSRRIDAENRLFYMIDGKSVAFLSLKIIIRSIFGRLYSSVNYSKVKKIK